jgi:glycosyltransferase involved in cell wall biosynthesis
MATPKISIVLPTYNGARYIRTSIESCLTQTFPDFELIVVNDCSTDETLGILDEYALKDNRILIINNEFNKKLPLSLNTGFEKARGQYFTWTSDDNYYAPHALQEMLTALEANPQADLVYCDYHLIDDDGNITGVRKMGDVNTSFNKWFGAGACFLYKREVHAANNGYNPAAFLIEDYDFFVRAFMKFNFQYLPKTDLYYYREHASSLTAQQNHTINAISKIFLERNLPGLEKKLTTAENGLLYRKFAVYYAVSMNNTGKYKHYLRNLRTVSLKQVFITVLYVVTKKTVQTVVLGGTGLIYFLKLVFKK